MYTRYQYTLDSSHSWKDGWTKRSYNTMISFFICYKQGVVIAGPLFVFNVSRLLSWINKTKRRYVRSIEKNNANEKIIYHIIVLSNMNTDLLYSQWLSELPGEWHVFKTINDVRKRNLST